MQNKDAVLEFKDVLKTFKNFNYKLSIKQFSFLKGKIYFLYGKNGAGKTSLFKLVTGELKPDSGKIHILGTNTSKISKSKFARLRQNIGIMWQDLRLIENRTIFENIALPLQIKKHSSKNIEKSINKILKETKLYEYRFDYPNEVPYGICQKVALIRALVSKPKIIVADEPMVHLDSNTEKEIWEMLNNWKKQDTTVIFFTSRKYVIDNFKGEVINLYDGRIMTD